MQLFPSGSCDAAIDAWKMKCFLHVMNCINICVYKKRLVPDFPEIVYYMYVTLYYRRTVV